ncbi:SIS domain-containing protein [Mycoplasma sp. NEAQ87857]|uniref:MurR/RpiR family transcriptional regulator n=1 Tax=Mycoplasma sp. NEAQ87857 TaxID=2683967 RepID=UPI001318F1DE|nr:MurR/RpiR family transcriptional regulator [Mycoplasma sp. NEAQ87857]QGZ97802.1 SIS domain-containing protein [Mycoplasma sp. NEAQ87857]
MQKNITKPLIERKSGLSKNDIKILDFINNINNNRFNYTIRELAELVNVSVASITRFVKKYDFRNYHKFSIEINRRMQNFIDVYKINSKINNNIDVIIEANRYVLNTINSEKMLNLIQESAKLINHSNKIFVFGCGSSLRMSQNLASNLLKIGKSVIFANDFHIFFPSLANGDSNDVLIVFSNYFSIPEVHFVINEATKKGIKLILVANNSKNIQTNINVDVAILYELIETSSIDIPLAGKMSQLIISDLIFENCLINDPKLRNNLEKSVRMIEDWKELKNSIPFKELN